MIPSLEQFYDDAKLAGTMLSKKQDRFPALHSGRTANLQKPRAAGRERLPKEIHLATETPRYGSPLQEEAGTPFLHGKG